MDTKIDKLRRERNLRHKRIDEIEKEIRESNRLIKLHITKIKMLDAEIVKENKLPILYNSGILLGTHVI